MKLFLILILFFFPKEGVALDIIPADSVSAEEAKSSWFIGIGIFTNIALQPPREIQPATLPKGELSLAYAVSYLNWDAHIQYSWNSKDSLALNFGVLHSPFKSKFAFNGESEKDFLIDQQYTMVGLAYAHLSEQSFYQGVEVQWQKLTSSEVFEDGISIGNSESLPFFVSLKYTFGWSFKRGAWALNPGFKAGVITGADPIILSGDFGIQTQYGF